MGGEWSTFNPFHVPWLIDTLNGMFDPCPSGIVMVFPQVSFSSLYPPESHSPALWWSSGTIAGSPMPHLCLSSSLSRSEVSSPNDHTARQVTWSETGLWEMLGMLGPVAHGRTGISSIGNTCCYTPASCYWEGARDQRVSVESVNIKYYIKISWFYMLTTNSYVWNSVWDGQKLLWVG